MTKRSVRPATSSDAAAIAAMAQEFFTEVFNACALPAAHPLRAQVLTQTRQMWEETLAGNRTTQGQTLVALEEQTPVGFIANSHAPALELEQPSGRVIPEGQEISSLYVHRSFRRIGHASRLLAALVDTLHPESMRLWVAPEDTLTIRFIQGCGFSPAGMRRHFVFDSEIPAARDEHLWWTLRS